MPTHAYITYTWATGIRWVLCGWSGVMQQGMDSKAPEVWDMTAWSHSGAPNKIHYTWSCYYFIPKEMPSVTPPPGHWAFLGCTYVHVYILYIHILPILRYYSTTPALPPHISHFLICAYHFCIGKHSAAWDSPNHRLYMRTFTPGTHTIYTCRKHLACTVTCDVYMCGHT